MNENIGNAIMYNRASFAQNIATQLSLYYNYLPLMTTNSSYTNIDKNFLSGEDNSVHVD